MKFPYLPAELFDKNAALVSISVAKLYLEALGNTDGLYLLNGFHSQLVNDIIVHLSRVLSE